jgi:hypothetical protein
MQQVLKALVRAARAGVVAAELLDQLLLAVHDPHASLHVRLGGVAAATLAGALKSAADRGDDRSRRGPCAWNTSCSLAAGDDTESEMKKPGKPRLDSSLISIPSAVARLEC